MKDNEKPSAGLDAAGRTKEEVDRARQEARETDVDAGEMDGHLNRKEVNIEIEDEEIEVTSLDVDAAGRTKKEVDRARQEAREADVGAGEMDGHLNRKEVNIEIEDEKPRAGGGKKEATTTIEIDDEVPGKRSLSAKVKDVVNKMRQKLTRSGVGAKSKGSAAAPPMSKDIANKDKGNHR